MSFTAQTPQPTLAWQFESSNVDSVVGLTPNLSTFAPTALQVAPTYVPGIYRQAISFNNTLSPAGDDPNCYATYDVSSFSLSSNSTTLSLWLKSGLTYPTTAGTSPFYVNLQGASYNGLYTPGETSTIQFRKGTTPITAIGSVTAQTGVWQHHCMVFSNVGAVGTSNIFSSYYVNGSFIATANNTIQGFTTLNIGCINSGANGALCSIDDLRVFNTVLTAAQVQAVYAAQGMPGRGVQARAVQPFLAGNATILYRGAPTGNTAAYFPGSVGSYIDLGASSATNINQNTSNIFIEAWVYFIDFSVAHRIFARAPDTVSPTGTVDIVFRTTSTTLYFNYGSGGVAGGASGPSALTAGRWYHVAISSVVGGGNSYCFIDGVPGAGIVPVQDTYNASYKSLIGVGSSDYSKMYIRDLRVIREGVVPTGAFTPEAATWAYGSVPSYVTGGTNVLGLAAQYMTPTTFTD